MLYRIENKKFDLKGKKIYKIASGSTGDVYKYKGEAIKIFNDGDTRHMSLEEARYLSDIHTNRILLPKKLVFYEDAFKGYTMRLVKKSSKKQRIITKPVEELVSNVRCVESDIKTLSEKKVLLNGIAPENVVFNGRLYITDPMQYKKLDLCTTKYLENLNKYQFHVLLTELIITELKRCNFDEQEIERIKSLFKLKDLEEDTSTFLESVIEPNTTIKQMVKKIN